MGNRNYEIVLRLLLNHHLRVAATDHRFLGALEDQREEALRRLCENPVFYPTNFPLLPIIWSRNPAWHMNLILCGLLRQDTLLRELDDTEPNIREIPDDPYYAFGVCKGTWDSELVPVQEEVAKIRSPMTAQEVLNLVFFAGVLLLEPPTTFIAPGSRFQDGTIPVLGYRNGSLTFHAELTAQTAVPTVLHRQHFPKRTVHL